MSLTSLLIPLSLTAVGTFCCSAIAIKKKRLFHSTAILLGIAIFSYSSSVPALAATESANPDSIKSFVSEQQQELEEDLNLTPGGGHYSGIEYAERTTGVEKAISDESIEQTLEEYNNGNLTVAVANGSVRISGRVENKDIARHIIDQTKAIPGVHEVTFDLGLENRAS